MMIQWLNMAKVTIDSPTGSVERMWYAGSEDDRDTDTGAALSRGIFNGRVDNTDGVGVMT